MDARKEKDYPFSKARLWFPVVTWMAIIFFASSVPGERIPALFPSQDVLFHGLTYGILALFFYRALRFSTKGLSAFVLVAFSSVFGMLYGISDEFHQMFISGRSAAVSDALVDSAGALAGSLLANFISPWLR